MFRVTVTELAAFSVCEQKGSFVRRNVKPGVKPESCSDKRQKGSFIHAVLDKKAKK